MKKLLFIINFLIVTVCNYFEAKPPSEIKEGDKLKAVYYTENQPTSLNEYNKFAKFIGQGVIVIFKPDSNPVLIKTIQVDLVLNQASIDKSGLIWIIAPDMNFEYGNNKIYIINPHTEIVYKSIDLPKELRRPSWMDFAETEVYFGSDRNGFSVGLGSIHRTTYNVRKLSEFDTSGSVNFKGLFKKGNDIFLFCSYTLKSQNKIYQYNLLDNSVKKTFFNTSFYTNDKSFIFAMDRANQMIFKLGYNSLKQICQSTGDNFYLLTNDDNYIYTAYHSVHIINVYSKQNLEKVREIQFQPSDSIRINNNFGFINDELLMLNENFFYNVKTDKLLKKIFPLEYPLAISLMLAEKDS